MTKYIFCGFFLLLFVALNGQDSRLANEYFNSGEYEKAAIVYKKLYDKQKNTHFYFEQYIKSLLAMDAYDEAETAIKKQLKANPKQMQLYVSYGEMLERQFRPEEADKMFRKAIDELPADINVISNLGNSFTRLAKNDLALETFLKGEIITKNDKIFINNIANLYKRKGDSKKMIEYYIKSANQYPDRIEQATTKFQRYLSSDEDLDELKSQLYVLIQDDEENPLYPELLQWVFTEREDFKSALRQARALDRKLEENGERVIKLAGIAKNAGHLPVSIKAYEYILQEKGEDSPHYVTAKSSLLRCKRDLVLNDPNFLPSELDTIDMEYQKFIAEMGINSKTEYLVKEYGDFLALHKNDLPRAIKVLEDLAKLSTINKYTRANTKISLADYYLMSGEVWDATLLYSQVEKEFKEEHLGEVSRYKNAMLAYYAGEFGWAQEQFDILESATSKLISNDAIDMSIFIMDNMGLDTTDLPLKMFSEAQLFTVQNKHDAAFRKLSEIIELFPEHALQDDILYQQAELYKRKRDYNKALELYTEVYTTYVEEIRADNALMNAAELYELYLDDAEKAKELYEKLFIDFSNSTFAIQARKKYRLLRGDDI